VPQVEPPKAEAPKPAPARPAPKPVLSPPRLPRRDLAPAVSKLKGELEAHLNQDRTKKIGLQFNIDLRADQGEQLRQLQALRESLKDPAVFELLKIIDQVQFVRHSQDMAIMAVVEGKSRLLLYKSSNPEPNKVLLELAKSPR
jgi:hypothetical protein